MINLEAVAKVNEFLYFLCGLVILFWFRFRIFRIRCEILCLEEGKQENMEREWKNTHD